VRDKCLNAYGRIASIRKERWGKKLALGRLAASGRYAKLYIATPMYRCQLCVVAGRQMAVDE
jgi:hypothetical protein